MDKEKISKRIAELWNMRDKHPRHYVECRYGNEKENLYFRYGHDNEIMFRAREIYNKL